jgi:hypothetical protein
MLLLVVTIFFPARVVAMALAAETSGCVCAHAVDEHGARKKCCCTHADDGTRVHFDASDCPCGSGLFVAPQPFAALVPVPILDRVSPFSIHAPLASRQDRSGIERPPKRAA